MNRIPNLGRQRSLAHCAPFSDRRTEERSMRIAVHRARKRGPSAEKFSCQQAFDRTVAQLVRTIPVPPEISEWFANEKLITAPEKRSWRNAVRNPVIIAIALALLVIAGIFAFKIHERMQNFPGSETAKKLLTIASATRVSQLEPVQSDAGELADLFFMKYRLEHHDVPPEFARLRTVGCRVFDDDEGHRVAQIALAEKRMQLFFFPAGIQKNGRASDWSEWRFVEQEAWTGAVQQRNGVCFMAALRGEEKDLEPYLLKKNQ